MNRADLIDWGIHLAMSGMPIDACSALGEKLSPFMGRKKHPGAHRNAIRIIAQLQPELASDPARLDQAADRLWACVGRSFAEYAILHRILKAKRIHFDGREHLDTALASGRPLITMFPHTANFDLSMAHLAFHAPGRVGAIVHPPTEKARADIALRVRSRVPFDLYPISRNVWRRALDRLRQPAGVLMMAADEEIAGRVWAPFFGRRPRLDGNLGKAVRMALLTGATLVPFHNERLGGAHFVTRVFPPIEFSGDSRDDAAVLDGVMRLDAVFSPPVKRLVEQWYMALVYTG